MTATTIRYVATYIGRDGLRTLMQPAQGRYTYATPDEAHAWIEAVYDPAGPTNPDVRTSVWGPDPRCEVRPCACWAGHHDPVGIYFEDTFAEHQADDPHCTCNDCIDAHARNLTGKA